MKFKVLFLLTYYFSILSVYLLEASNKFHPDKDIALSLTSIPSDTRFNIYNYTDVSSLSELKSISNFFNKEIDDWAIQKHRVTFIIHFTNIMDYPVLIFDNQLKVDLTFSATYFAGDMFADDMCDIGIFPQIHQREEKVFVSGKVNNITYLRKSFFPAEKLSKIQHVDFADGNNVGISVSGDRYFSWCFSTLIKGAPPFQ